MSKDKIEETAAGGSVSAHSIAVRTDGTQGDFPMQKRGGSFLDFMSDFNSKLKNKVKMKPVSTKKPYSKKLDENTSLDQVFSKLGGIRNQGKMEDQNAQTYGVEDDDGNLMKITVKADQAEKFEVALAQELGELENYKMTGRGGYGREVSIAEVLYNLKQEFDIITVEFPEIPSDKVYNADKVSDPEDVAFGEEDFQNDGDDFSNEDEFNMDDMDAEGDLGGEGDELGDLEGEEGDMPEDEEDLGVEFDEDEGEDDASSVLKNIIQMLTKQAEAQAAQAEAEAEKSRALQAEYSVMAAKEEMHKQQELAKMERELEEQKSKEKTAKDLADLAKYKLRNVAEGGGFLGTVATLLELDDLENEATIRLKRRQAAQIKDPTERRLRMQAINTDRRLVKHRGDQERQEREESEDGDDDNINDNNNRNNVRDNSIFSMNRGQR